MIRLARFGAKKKPFYRIVVIEKEKARNGQHRGGGTLRSADYSGQGAPDHDRIAHWTKSGAQLSDTVARLLEKNPAPAPAPAA